MSIWSVPYIFGACGFPFFFFSIFIDINLNCTLFEWVSINFGCANVRDVARFACTSHGENDANAVGMWFKLRNWPQFAHDTVFSFHILISNHILNVTSSDEFVATSPIVGGGAVAAVDVHCATMWKCITAKNNRNGLASPLNTIAQTQRTPPDVFVCARITLWFRYAWNDLCELLLTCT